MALLHGISDDSREAPVGHVAPEYSPVCADQQALLLRGFVVRVDLNLDFRRP